MSAVSISVVVPLYNKRPFVAQALASILAQGINDVEVVVVDDGSTDGGAELVRSLGIPQIVLVSQPNAGVSAARNRGIEVSTGELVAFLDADDWWLPGYLLAILSLHRAFPVAGFYCTGYWRVDTSGRELGASPSVLPSSTSGLLTDFYRLWRKGSFTSASAIVVSRRMLAALAPAFPEGERLGEDQDLWFRLAERAPVAFCSQALSVYRVDVAGSATHGDQAVQVLPCFDRLAQRLKSGAVPPAMRADARKLLGSHALNIARRRAQAGDFLAGCRQAWHPWSFGHPTYWLRTLAWLGFSAWRHVFKP